MISTPLAAAYRTRFNIRPIKHAYFVLKDDWDGLIRAVRLACTQWGGIRSLLIPLGTDAGPIDEAMESLLRLHEPDHFVDYAYPAADFERRELLADQLRRLFPYRNVSVHGAKAYERHDVTLHTLGAIPASVLARESLTVVRITGSKEEAARLATVFGEIYPNQVGMYREALRVHHRTVRVGSDAFWSGQSFRTPHSSVINMTAYGIGTQRVTGGSYGDDHFALYVTGSVAGLCMFWNVRATEEATGFDVTEHPKAATREHVKGGQ